MTPTPFLCVTVRHVLALGLSTAGFALVAVASPSPLSDVVTWSLTVVTCLSAVHGGVLTHREVAQRPSGVPLENEVDARRPTSGPALAQRLPHLPTPAQQVWALPAGWQTMPHKNGSLFTRPDGRQFLVTDRPHVGERGIAVVVFTPGTPRPPTRQGTCWHLTGAREDVTQLLEVM